MLYQGKLHGFAHRDFHGRCDGITRSLVIIETTNGYVFGGYTEIGWGDSPTSLGIFKTDKNAFIFSLINSHQNPVKFYLKKTRDKWS